MQVDHASRPFVRRGTHHEQLKICEAIVMALMLRMACHHQLHNCSTTVQAG
jgi:hypothetical protein